MKAIVAGLLWLASVTGASAYFPIDIENHARWVVLDDMPVLANGKPIRPEVTNLRTNDIAAYPTLISAVCGTLDFHNTDDGMVDFMLLYSVDDDGHTTMVGRPYFYGQLSQRNFHPQYEAALKFCGNPAEAAVVAQTGSTSGTALTTATGVAAETNAAAIVTRP
jgi:hypothetical protein